MEVIEKRDCITIPIVYKYISNLNALSTKMKFVEDLCMLEILFGYVIHILLNLLKSGQGIVQDSFHHFQDFWVLIPGWTVKYMKTKLRSLKMSSSIMAKSKFIEKSKKWVMK